MPYSKFIAIILLFFAAIPLAAQENLPVSGVLNPDFAQDLALVTSLSITGEEGIFAYAPNGELLLGMQVEEIKSAAYEAMGGFLIAYDESGQALFQLPDGTYQMQLTTSNGSLNFNYLNRHSSVQASEALTMDKDVLLEQSVDEQYQIVLLQSGELAVIIAPNSSALRYQIRFTGIPALNIHNEILTDDATS